MSTQPRSTKLTYEDYLLFSDDGKRHELIQGDHYMTPAPSTKHQRISRNLVIALGTFVREHRCGEVFDAPCDIIFSDEDVVQPDVLFISTERSSIITEPNIKGAPDLVVEILSDATRKKDEVTKRKLYERFGVTEYWIVDPELETVKVFRLTDHQYVRTAEISTEAHDALTTPLLPEFRLPLGDLFE
ncbi:MAG: Uma2 family endonuclease [Nitrospirota bacterium]